MRAVALGAAVVLGVAVPVSAIASVVLDEGSNAVFPLAALVLAAFVAGGWIAGRQEPRSALAVGAAAAVAGYLLAQAVAIVLVVLDDGEVRPAVVVANALIAAAAGLAGGRLALR